MFLIVIIVQEVIKMDEKCSKYEGIFVFSDEETFNRHLSECEDCASEHKKMQRVSELIDEVKFYYYKKNRKIRKIKAVCAVLFLVFFSAFFGVISNDGDLADALMYGDTLSAEELGFPVDSYGLLMVD